MTEREMFEKSFQRPTNYFNMHPREQGRIDSELGILDWKGEGLNTEDLLRYADYYK